MSILKERKEKGKEILVKDDTLLTSKGLYRPALSGKMGRKEA